MAQVEMVRRWLGSKLVRLNDELRHLGYQRHMGYQRYQLENQVINSTHSNLSLTRWPAASLLFNSHDRKGGPLPLFPREELQFTVKRGKTTHQKLGQTLGVDSLLVTNEALAVAVPDVSDATIREHLKASDRRPVNIHITQSETEWVCYKPSYPWKIMSSMWISNQAAEWVEDDWLCLDYWKQNKADARKRVHHHI
uniref:Uncharacterized protein n=1 Tax=Branchiostoma floridae TaxID=7739 RepID=C4A053_BRAFL|eukprot:XP_002585810.1 hypothetical protein BRAFLDRAFT_111065 [Branchiostoma floridae]